MRNAIAKWQEVRNWKAALNQFAVLFSPSLSSKLSDLQRMEKRFCLICLFGRGMTTCIQVPEPDQSEA